MGMWQGLYLGLQNIRERDERNLDREEARRAREEDMAFRREMFQAQVLESRRNTVLEVLASRRQQEAQSQAEVRGAVARGFSLETAQFLQRTGDLNFIMESAAAENYSPSVIRAYEDSARQLIARNSEEGEVSDESVGIVLSRSFERGADLNDPRSSYSIMLEEVLNETSIEKLEDMQLRLMEDQQRQAMAPPTGLATYTGGVDTTEQARIRNQLIDRFSSAFGPNVFRKLEDGSFEISANAPPEVSMLVNRAVDEVVSMSRGPTRVGNVAENIATVGNKILGVAAFSPIEARDIVTHFDVVVGSNNPQDFFSYLEQLSQAGADVTPLVQQPPVIAAPTQEEVMEELGGTGNRRRPRNTPPTSTPTWNIPLDESVIRR
jgi:hypothetical protein